VAGYQPVPSGYQPDGTATAFRGNENQVLQRVPSAVPVGKLPTGASKLPELPIFRTQAQARLIQNAPGCCTFRGRGERFSATLQHDLPGCGFGLRYPQTQLDEPTMKSKAANIVQQPDPFTPGLTKEEVRHHAFTLYRDRLQHGSLTLEDWVLAEKDLVKDIQEEEAS
jgi:hypothetical protein